MIRNPAAGLIPLAAALALSACGGGDGSTPAARSPSMDLKPVEVVANDSGLADQWYRQSVFMEIFVRSYKDSNGDGKGDLKGVISKLDYLADLGIRGIWLMPVFKSGVKEHGYDPIDFRQLEPDYGTEDDLKLLLSEAHKRGIGIVVDYPMNHGSSASPLFHDSVYGLESKRDWFVWSNTQQKPSSPANPNQWHEHLGNYYFAIFHPTMPDFNLNNESVVQYHFSSMRKWLNMGLDGFRMDAVQALIETGRYGYLDTNTPGSMALLQRARSNVAQYPKRFVVCEDPPAPELVLSNGCDSSFFFGLQEALLKSAKDGKPAPALTTYLQNPNLPQMSIFLSNHDTFAGARVFTQLAGDEARYKLAAASLLTLPGIPFIYYGEEIGISNAGTPTPDNPDAQLRTPMSWTGDIAAHVGFSSVQPFRPLAYNAATHNVAAQQGQPGSLLETYRSLIALRNAEPSLSRGSFTLLATGNDSVLAYARTSGSESVIVVLNYGATATSVTLGTGLGNAVWTRRYPDTAATVTADAGGSVAVALPPVSAQVFKLQL